MKYIRYFNLVFMFTVIMQLFTTASCFSDSLDDANIRGTIVKLEKADPNKDVEEAILRNDWRFVGVMGYTTEVPGVEHFSKQYRKEYGVRVIEGTTDNVTSPDLAHLNEIAHSYALKYNKLLLKKIQSKQNAQ
jgi:hypothetical protein